jgi:hypothetical protein
MDYSPQALRPLQDLEEVKKLLLARCEKVIEGLKLCLLKLVHILVLYTICSSIEFGDLRNCVFYQQWFCSLLSQCTVVYFSQICKLVVEAVCFVNLLNLSFAECSSSHCEPAFAECVAKELKTLIKFMILRLDFTIPPAFNNFNTQLKN